jgi:hypothetical protein
MKLYIWLMSKHILLTEFERELSKGIENKEKINYAFRRLLEFHNQYNIYFPACSPEVFKKRIDNLDTNEKPIKGKIREWTPVKYIDEFIEYHRKIGPFLDFTTNNLVKYYTADKIALLNRVYDFKNIIENKFPYFIDDFKTRDLLDYLIHNFYDSNSTSVTIALIYWELIGNLKSQPKFLAYIKNEYNIELKKIRKINDFDSAPREKHQQLENQIKRQIQNYYQI